MTDLRVLVFGFTIESFVTLYLGLKLIGISVNVKKLLLIGVLMAVMDFFLRPQMPKLGLPEVAEMIISIGVTVILLHYFLKISWSVSILSVLLGVIVAGISQSIMFLVFQLVNIDFEKMLKSALWWKILIFAHLDNIILYILFIIENFKPFNIIDFSKREGTFIK